MKRENKIKHNLLVVLLLILFFSTSGFSQTSELNEESNVIPEQVMKQIVRKVLIHYFKPRSQTKVIYLSDEGIQQSWLPKIKGVNFQLLDTAQHRQVSHYTFQLYQDKHSVAFASGSWGSGFRGDIWNFRILKQTVKIWHNKNDWFGMTGDGHNRADPILLLPKPPPPPPMPKKP